MWLFCHLLLSVKLITLPVSLITVIHCLKMMKKDPVRLYGYYILPLMIIKRLYILGAWTVMQKSVLR